MTVTCPPQDVLALMNDTVSWEAFNGQDGHGDPSWKAAVTLTCWVEERGYSGGMEAHRLAHADVFDAFVDVFFDANDANVLTFDLRDRFTLSTQTAAAKATQPDRILTFRGPDGARWITLVTL